MSLLAESISFRMPGVKGNIRMVQLYSDEVIGVTVHSPRESERKHRFPYHYYPLPSGSSLYGQSF
ncbi:hypothetical protein [Paenibacillus eucommiae]|uniref:Uncharacterized protein n=1 Tax=Paenibacillus eucommiae TaxID=1355755 RepID=A0ABS4J344_9BACL|nr:hypothetical protein [Paenibacillus eucommiae]MBP1993239.1 hypothetical protein [Paenibacillus eucommiae]